MQRNAFTKARKPSSSEIRSDKTPAFFQPKLTINQPCDVYEQQADAMAAHVMRMPEAHFSQRFFPAKSSIQKKCSHCVQEKLQMKGDSNSNSGMTAPSSVHNTISAGGQKLDADTRNFMESRFGYDFSNVRIHNDNFAHQSSSEIQAKAYTHANHIAFAAGQYQPRTYSGKELLAHELTHVIQQSVGAFRKIQRSPDKPPVKAKAPAVTTIEFSRVNAPNTPKGINRIIPRKDQEVDVKLGSVVGADPVILSIDGAGGGNGTVDINGKATYNITGSEKIILTGKDQTEPGNANKLVLIATQGKATIKRSNNFSVAAYPSSIGFHYNQILHGGSIPQFPKLLFWGVAYRLILDSDSGVAGDCNKTSISENVVINKHAGFFKGIGSVRSDFQGSTRAQFDYNAVSNDTVSQMKKDIDASDVSKSEYVAHQFYRFACERTGIAEDRAKGPKVRASGFKITKSVGQYFFKTQKEGFDNNGVTAGVVDDTGAKRSDVS